MTPGAGAANGAGAGAGFAVASTDGVLAEEGISEDIRGLVSGFAVTVVAIFGVETDGGISAGCFCTTEGFVAVVSTAALGSLLAQHLPIIGEKRETTLNRQ